MDRFSVMVVVNVYKSLEVAHFNAVAVATLKSRIELDRLLSILRQQFLNRLVVK